jgi:hypothetical protein
MISRLTLVFACIVAATASSAAEERLLVSVDKNICPNATYTSIQAAVDAASPGDSILVCPGTYNEQLVIAKPVTIRGKRVNQLDRVQIQPSTLAMGSGGVAVVTVQNTNDVRLTNVAVDASKNTISGCTPILSAVHFLNASGELEDDAISGATITNPTGCATGPGGGNGFGVLAESTGSGRFKVEIEGSSIHDYTKEGVRAVGDGLTINIHSNIISGLGPAGGFSLQFGILVANGAVGFINGNQITEGDCGTLSITDCINARSEGVTFRAVGDGSVVDNNVITRAQSGIFINFANRASISHNLIANITGLDGIDAQGMSNSILDGNSIFNATPLENTSCGIAEFPGPGNAGGIEANNKILKTLVNDAWCGVVYVLSTDVDAGRYFNVMFTQFRSDIGPPVVP